MPEVKRLSTMYGDVAIMRRNGAIEIVRRNSSVSSLLERAPDSPEAAFVLWLTGGSAWRPSQRPAFVPRGDRGGGGEVRPAKVLNEQSAWFRPRECVFALPIHNRVVRRGVAVAPAL